MWFAQYEKHPSALRTDTRCSCLPRTLLVATFAVMIGVAASACTGETPQLSQGTTGNAIQSMKPPIEVPHVDAGPRVFSETCFADPAAVNCPVSFSKDIYPNMESTGEWKCAAANCHGGNTQPAIGDGNAAGTYNNLVAWTSDQLDAYYITPCTGNDLTQSSIICNLGGDPSGCSSPMPLLSGGASAPTQDELNALKTWIGCGAPLN